MRTPGIPLPPAMGSAVSKSPGAPAGAFLLASCRPPGVLFRGNHETGPGTYTGHVPGPDNWIVQGVLPLLNMGGGSEHSGGQAGQ
jgi:hypothetical protein